MLLPTLLIFESLGSLFPKLLVLESLGSSLPKLSILESLGSLFPKLLGACSDPLQLLESSSNF